MPNIQNACISILLDMLNVELGPRTCMNINLFIPPLNAIDLITAAMDLSSGFVYSLLFKVVYGVPGVVGVRVEMRRVPEIDIS